MIRPRLALLATLLAFAPALPGPVFAPAQAQTPAETAALLSVLQLDETLAVVAQEGAAHGRDLESQMFPGKGGAEWEATVAALYDPAVLRPRLDAALTQALAGQGATVAEATAFYGSDLGQRILTAELAARRTLMDVEAAEAAEVEVQKMTEARNPRLRALRKLAEAGDLIELNTLGGLSAELAFSDGLAEGMPAAQRPPQDQRAAEVWAQEGAMRAEVGAWLLRFMVLAYGGLSDQELAAYVAFSESPAGKAVNAAQFRAFDAVLVPLSRDLGRAAGRQMLAQQI